MKFKDVLNEIRGDKPPRPKKSKGNQMGFLGRSPYNDSIKIGKIYKGYEDKDSFTVVNTNDENLIKFLVDEGYEVFKKVDDHTLAFINTQGKPSIRKYIVGTSRDVIGSYDDFSKAYKEWNKIKGKLFELK